MISWDKWPKSGALLLFLPCHSPAQKEEAFKMVFNWAKQCLSEGCPRSLSLMSTNVHPDFNLIKPDKESRWIRVDAIRELIAWSMVRPQIASRKIALLFPAEAMNIQAANAFLKTLEESHKDILFILIANRLKPLPATLLSRCHIIRHRRSGDENDIETHQNLKLEMLQDLNLLRTEEDSVALAFAWVKKEVEQVVYCLSLIIYEKIIALLKASKILLAQKSFEYMDILLEAHKTLLESHSANVELLMENLLIRYVNCFKEPM